MTTPPPLLLDETRTTGTAVVLGAGTMGGGIAADLANAGWEVRLLDVTPEAASAGRERATTRKPPLLFLPEYAGRILPDGMENAREHLRAADWVVEAVAERMDVKRDVLALVAAAIPAHAVVTSNTSGLGLAAMSAHLPPALRRRFLGSHFLNPPRYLKLLEVVPTPETDPEVTAGFVRFAERVLGHRVVLAKDTPGFISTRLWIAHLMDTLHAAEEHGIDLETVDYLTGPLVGRPRSATCRMADIVGLDVVAAIAGNQRHALPHDDPLRTRLEPPAVLRALLDAGRTGEKADAGFYRREGRSVLAYDAAAGEYRPRRDVHIEAVEAVALLPLPERLRALEACRDAPWGRFLNGILDALGAYARAVGPEVAADVLAVDRTMRWGFGWEMGPFGVDDARRGASEHYAGTPLPRSYRAFGGGDAGEASTRPWPVEPEYVDLARVAAAEGGTLARTEAASLLDLGDGVWCVAFHTKMNTFNPALCAFLRDAVTRAEAETAALVIGNQGAHFSAGYDLKRLAAAMEQGDTDTIDREMKACQDAFLAIRYARIPVVAAVHGFTLGAGCECALHCHGVVAASETYVGLPEVAVGVVPCGGGIKETLRRYLEAGLDPVAAARASLRAVVLNRNSGSAHEAQRDGRLRPTDAICRNPDRLLYEAKRRALALRDGFAPPERADFPGIEAAGLSILREDIANWHADGTLNEHDARIADRVALVLSGGMEPAPGPVSEHRLLELERIVFLDLCRSPQSLARMRHFLDTGKPLRD